MKIKLTSIVSILALSLIALGDLRAESVHQSLAGTAAKTGSGEDAVAKNAVETKSLPSGEKLARLAGSNPQWGYVNYWFGLPAPAGPVILRVKAYVEDGDTAPYAFYIKRDGAEPLVQKLEIPANTAKNTFVTVDIPVDLNNEWNGIALKKIAASDKPSVWIESLSVVKP
jgi:hypothetical protein